MTEPGDTMIEFAHHRLVAKWITGVQISNTDDYYQIRVRTLDGREYTERYADHPTAQRMMNRLLDAIRESKP